MKSHILIKKKKKPNFTQEDLNNMPEGLNKQLKKKQLDDYNSFKNNYPKSSLDPDRDIDIDDDKISENFRNIMKNEIKIIDCRENIKDEEEIKLENTVIMDNNNIRNFMLGLFFVNYNYSVYKDKD